MDRWSRKGIRLSRSSSVPGKLRSHVRRYHLPRREGGQYGLSRGAIRGEVALMTRLLWRVARSFLMVVCAPATMAAAGDAWTLVRIAGRSSIAICSRYVHPSEDSVVAAIANLGGHNS